MESWVKRSLGGAAAVLGTAAVAFYVNERRSEQPAFTLEEEDGAFSIRRYPALLVAETLADGSRKDALSTGFDRLARFIFAKDRQAGDGRRIAMTAPVLSDRAGGEWRTRFVMPRGFTETSLPRPLTPVRTATLPGRRVAALRFAGVGTDKQLAKAERQLRERLGARGIDATGPVEYAFYNSPFIPGPLRRNEVLLPV